MTIGNQVKEARKKSGLTQKQLSELTGITQCRISGIESGKVKNITFQTVKLLAKTLKIKICIS